jgi:ferrous iron transport protein B
MRIALIGNPNTGKTTLFNRLCGLRAKTANFPGSTVDARVGTAGRGGTKFEIVDLPGVYGLRLDLPESRLCRDCLDGKVAGCEPDALLVVADATNLPRNLQFVAQGLRRGLPTVVALNMIDLAAQGGLTIDERVMSERLGCAVIAVSARTGAGFERLLDALKAPVRPQGELPPEDQPGAAQAWADEMVAACAGGSHAIGGRADTVTDRLDAAFTNPVVGLLMFVAVMTGLFMTIFSLASVPMDLIELLFEHVGSWVRETLPEGAIADLLADGVVGGLAGTLVFLPQICLLFFLLSLLEDTGYLARAAFVMDRIMRRFGLPGQAFVPLLSSHACALPGIMATRLIPDRRDRLATILVAPFMSCSARLPVYVLLTSLLFPDSAVLAGLAFAGCYLLGALVAMLSALLARRTILKGPSRAMMLELPTYKWPSLRTAFLTTVDRALVFLKNAGTVIVAICIIMWWLSAYPRLDGGGSDGRPTDAAAEVAASELSEEQAAQRQLEHSFAGRIGGVVEPVFEPIGCDWRMSIGVMTSFAAREVFVSTLTVLLGTTDDIEDEGVIEAVRNAKRDDGSPLLTTASAASLLVFYVLAMQCLPTLAVTRRETGSWGWAGLQLGYMSVVAYVLALITFQSLRAMGVA